MEIWQFYLPENWPVALEGDLNSAARVYNDTIRVYLTAEKSSLLPWDRMVLREQAAWGVWTGITFGALLLWQVNPALRYWTTLVDMQILRKWLQREKPVDDRIDLKSRFELLSKMGMGTMSDVWKAKDLQEQRIVALKIIDPEKQRKINLRFPKGARPEEGEVAVSLDHRYIVKTFEYGVSNDDRPFLVMEFIDGISLLQYIELQNDTMKNYCLKWMIQIGEALQYFHSENWIHRDFCPKNILTDNSGNIKLIDFGLAVPNIPTFCAPGNRTGTADYMAPELVKRQRTDQRIDIYSYAVTCYQMCANHLPYPPGKNLSTIVKNLNRPPLDIRQFAPDLSGEIAGVIFKGLEKNPDERWQTAKEMTDAFEAIAREI